MSEYAQFVDRIIRDYQIANAVALIRTLHEEDRVTVMDSFCHHCGTDKLPCHCWNDE